MPIEQNTKGLVEVRFVGGFLHGRTTYMANPEFRMELESPIGELLCYCRRIVELSITDGVTLLLQPMHQKAWPIMSLSA